MKQRQCCKSNFINNMLYNIHKLQNAALEFNPTFFLVLCFVVKIVCKLGFICQEIVTYKPENFNNGAQIKCRKKVWAHFSLFAKF